MSTAPPLLAIHTNVPLPPPDTSHMSSWCGSPSGWGPVTNGFVTPCFVHTCIMMPLHSMFCIAVSFRLRQMCGSPTALPCKPPIPLVSLVTLALSPVSSSPLPTSAA